MPVSQENLSPGNCVAATVFPKEIMPLTINVATVYLLRAKRGFAQTRDCPAQTLDPWFVCANSRLPLYIF